MTAITVKATIREATRNDAPNCQAGGGHIDGAEGLAIPLSAVWNKKRTAKTPVTAGEIKAIADLYERKVASTDDGISIALCPKHPDGVTFDTVADDIVRSFLIQYDAPTPAVYKAKILAGMPEDEGTPLASPPDTSKMTYVFLADGRPVDGSLREAFVDPAKAEFYLKTTPARMFPGAPSVYWNGPFALGTPAPVVTLDTRENLMRALDRLDADTCRWDDAEDAAPVGQRFVRAELREAMGPKGYAYAALLPVGAASPNAPAGDPNDAPIAYFERRSPSGDTKVISVPLMSYGA